MSFLTVDGYTTITIGTITTIAEGIIRIIIEEILYLIIIDAIFIADPREGRDASTDTDIGMINIFP